MKLKIGITLDKEQKKHLKTIKWLMNGPRQTGRSTVIAYALIESVLQRQHSIPIRDHYPNNNADHLLARRIQELIVDNDLPLVVSIPSLTLRYSPDGL